MRRDDITDELAGESQAKSPQKLIELFGEILFLRDRLAILEEEAACLKEDLGL